MRVTVSHNKGREEAARLVEDTMANLLQSELPRPFHMTELRKEWIGPTMNFQTSVALGPLKMPVRGIIEVRETEIMIDIDLPPLLGKFIPEHKLRKAVEDRIRGQLTA
ncbi:MAG TPA: polyhydroxyalkanoic acid system family protein [Bryobacteraceae bacterium]|nr:polyhydroxyalkanoic acid system family protein [Bryobacteraceae bacterium]